VSRRGPAWTPKRPCSGFSTCASPTVSCCSPAPTSCVRVPGVERAGHTFASNVVITSPTFGSLPNPRGWICIDAQIRDHLSLCDHTPRVSHLQFRKRRVTSSCKGPPTRPAGGHSAATSLSRRRWALTRASRNKTSSQRLCRCMGGNAPAAVGKPGLTWPLMARIRYLHSTPTERIDQVLAEARPRHRGAQRFVVPPPT